MQCSKMTDLMMKYLDKDISETELKELEKHNLSCKSCNNEFNSLKIAMDLVEALPDIEPPYNFEMKVMEKIEKRRYRLSTASLLIGAIGLFSYAYYMILLVILPYIQNAQITSILYSYINYGIDKFTSYFTNILVYTNVTIENLLILRNILIKDYTNIVLCFAAFIVIMNIEFIKILNLQHE